MVGMIGSLDQLIHEAANEAIGASGISQGETEALGPLLLDLRRELGATFLLIEHDMPLIMGISDRIVALAAGRVLAEGTPAEIQANDEVVEAYLGGSIDLEAVLA